MSPTFGSVFNGSYDTRPRPADIVVGGHRYTIVRRRATGEDPAAGETTA
jgi:hypothetical protein